MLLVCDARPHGRRRAVSTRPVTWAAGLAGQRPSTARVELV